MLIKNLHTRHVVGMIKQFNLVTDEIDRCLKQMPHQSHRTIPSHPAADSLAKVVFQIFRGDSQTLHVGREAFKGFLACSTMLSLVIDIVQPQIKGFVEFGQGLAGKTGDKVGAHGSKETFDFTAALRCIRFGVDLGDAQCCGYLFQMP